MLAPIGLRLSEEKTEDLPHRRGLRLPRLPHPAAGRRDDKRFVYTYAPRRRCLDQGQGEGADPTGHDQPARPTCCAGQPGAAGLGHLLPARRVQGTFDYLGHFTWRRVVRWLRNKHHAANWKWLRRRYLPVVADSRTTGSAATTRQHRDRPATATGARGSRPPGRPPPDGRPPPPDLLGSERRSHDHRPTPTPVESRMRGNAHVRFGGRGGETDRPKGRHRPRPDPYTSRSTTKPPPTSSTSSHAATSTARWCSPPTAASAPGARSSPTTTVATAILDRLLHHGAVVCSIDGPSLPDAPPPSPPRPSSEPAWPAPKTPRYRQRRRDERAADALPAHRQGHDLPLPRPSDAPQGVEEILVSRSGELTRALTRSRRPSRMSPPEPT